MTGREQFFATPESGDLRLWAERTGDRNDPPVLLIMGTSAPGIGWPDELVDALAAAGRQVIRYDNRDTGRSTHVDFAARPYALADMAGDAEAVLDAAGADSAHVVGASLGGAIAQWLAVHRPWRVRTLTAVMTGPMGHSAQAAVARALAGQDPDPDDLPPPSPALLHHLTHRPALQQPGREEFITANLETWRFLNGEELPFDEAAARRFLAATHDISSDPSAAANHDLAGRRMTEDRLAPLDTVKAPTLVIHGTADPLRPLPHGEALARQIPGARLAAVPGMGHGLFSPGLPRRVAELIADHTATP